MHARCGRGGINYLHGPQINRLQRQKGKVVVVVIGYAADYAFQGRGGRGVVKAYFHTALNELILAKSRWEGEKI